MEPFVNSAIFFFWSIFAYCLPCPFCLLLQSGEKLCIYLSCSSHLSRALSWNTHVSCLFCGCIEGTHPTGPPGWLWNVERSGLYLSQAVSGEVSLTSLSSQPHCEHSNTPFPDSQTPELWGHPERALEIWKGSHRLRWSLLYFRETSWLWKEFFMLQGTSPEDPRARLENRTKNRRTQRKVRSLVL